jgi:IS30 family transposase
MKKDRHPTYEARCQIHALMKRGVSQTVIACDSAVYRSTISRELGRNSGKTGYYYHWAQAQAEDRQRKRRSRPRKMTAAVVAFIEGKLKEGWSPQQISGWLKHRQNRSGQHGGRPAQRATTAMTTMTKTTAAMSWMRLQRKQRRLMDPIGTASS